MMWETDGKEKRGREENEERKLTEGKNRIE